MMPRSVLLTAALVAGSMARCQDLDALKVEIQGKQPDEVRALIGRRFGPPTHTFGSGFLIEAWDVNGGLLVFHPADGPSFQNGGKRVWLMRTNNPAGLCLYGKYEMATKPESPSGTIYPIGYLYVAWDSSYKFRVERATSEPWKGPANDFFLLHPAGRVEVKYAFGVTAETRLEDLPDGSLVATVTFAAASGRSSKDYRIIANRTDRMLRFADDATPFKMEKGWLNYWR